MALIKINDRMINQMKEEFDLTFEQAKELLCADLASDKRELDLTNVADLIKNLFLKYLTLFLQDNLLMAEKNHKYTFYDYYNNLLH